MSKKNGKDGSPESQAPEGFDVNLARAEAAGWVAREPGNVVVARILGRFGYTTSDKQSTAYYQLQLIDPCLVYPNSEGDSDERLPAVQMPAGTIVNMAEAKAMEDLQSAIEMMSRGAVVDVWTGYKSKEPNRRSKGSHWVLFGPRLRIVKQPRDKDAPPF